MGHALDYYSEQHCGTDLLTCTLLMTQLDWDGLGWLVKGMCPAGEIASVSFLISSFTKSVPAGFRSQLWPEPRNNNRKESYRDTATLSAFYEGLEIKWVSQAQHVGPRKGDCLPASSKTLLSMAMLPHRHKYKTKKKTEARPGVFCTSGSYVAHSSVRGCGCSLRKLGPFCFRSSRIFLLKKRISPSWAVVQHQLPQ